MAGRASKNGATTPKVRPKRGNPATLAPAWRPGKSGNPAGRPKGSRNKLGEAFIADMYEAWQAKGKETIDRVIEERPHEFIKAVAGILPKELNVNTQPVQELSDDELAAALVTLRSLVASQAIGTGTEAPEGRKPSKILSTLQ